MPPKVSVNICCYNGEKYIEDTIRSILYQTFTDFEIIVIDDGSMDNTGEIVKRFYDQRIKYFYQKNMGLSFSRNRAVECSIGEYIALIDQDDLWVRNKLEMQVALLDLNPNVGLVYSDVYAYDEISGVTRRHYESKTPRRGWVTKYQLQANLASCPTVIMRKSFMQKLKPFRTDLSIAEEYEYFLRLSLISEFDFVNIPLATYRIHQSNTSKDLGRLFEEEIFILNNFSIQINNTALNKIIKDRLYEVHKKMSLFYLFDPFPSKSRYGLKKAISGMRPGFLKLIISLFSFLPRNYLDFITTVVKYIKMIYKREKNARFF